MRHFLVPTRRCLVILCAVLALCGLVAAWSLLRRETLVPVAGQVTVDGKPVITGTILFFPNKAKGNTYPLSTRGVIKNGVYMFFTRGKDGVVRTGVPPGWYRVTVEGVVGPSKHTPLERADVLRQVDLIMEWRGVIRAQGRVDPKSFFSNYDTPYAMEILESAPDGSCDLQLTRLVPRKSSSRRN